MNNENTHMEEKTIETLLEQKLIVPEIQREYVWGSNKVVISQFLSDLKENKSENINLGFLYSYNSNTDSAQENYVIDGQQRFTTLILLLCFLATKEKNNLEDFKKLIGVDLPSLNFTYRVRPLTENFLKKLFTEITVGFDFLAIKDCKWFISEYDDDVTIKSITKAFALFTELHIDEIQYERIKKHIKFWYFNVSQTSQGEELYITMNSRGEELKSYEKIKPFLLKKENTGKNWGKIWDDEWEDFFYRNLKGKKIESVDYAMNNLIKIALELKNEKEYNSITPSEDCNDISLSGIEKVFNLISKNIKFLDEGINIFQSLYNPVMDDKSLILLEILLIAFSKGYSEHEIDKLTRFISNCQNYNYIKNRKPVLRFIKDFKTTDAKDFYNYILNLKEKSSSFLEDNMLFTDKANNLWDENWNEELQKLIAIKQNLVSFDSIRKVEQWGGLEGKIHFLYRTSNRTAAEKPDWNNFEKRFETIKKYFIMNEKKAFIDDEKKKLFVNAFICHFTLWKYFDKQVQLFTNNILIWKKTLTSYTYSEVFCRLLVLSEEEIDTFVPNKTNYQDDGTRFIWEALCNINIQNFIFSKNSNARFFWYAKKRLALYPPYSSSDDDILFDFNNINRNSILSELNNKEIIVDSKNRIPEVTNLFKGWDIVFECIENKNKYRWYWDDGYIQNISNKESKNVKKHIETSAELLDFCRKESITIA